MSHFVERAILLHPCEVRRRPRLVPLVPRVQVADVDACLPPRDHLLVAVLVGGCELELATQPLLVGGEETETSVDVVEDGVIRLLLVELVEVEEASEVRVLAQGPSPNSLAIASGSIEDE